MRPKTIKFSGGEITFKNIPIEERNEVIKKIHGPKMVPVFDEENEEYILVPEIEAIKPVEEKNLPNVGYSFCQVGNMWSAVEVKLNFETKEAQVVSITPLHTNRNIGSERFRVKFGKNWF